MISSFRVSFQLGLIPPPREQLQRRPPIPHGQSTDSILAAQVPEDIKAEFREFCKDYDMSEAFRSIMHLLCRPGMKEFVEAHPQAKFWTFTNKDREDQGQIVR